MRSLKKWAWREAPQLMGLLLIIGAVLYGAALGGCSTQFALVNNHGEMRQESHHTWTDSGRDSTRRDTSHVYTAAEREQLDRVVEETSTTPVPERKPAPATQRH
ncbi:hypothetical protein HY091_03475 [Candidatus Kaiserbacteria bacterium]|nr:hypothetical protein [Candidatus Kaiserbacteria bacterium]